MRTQHSIRLLALIAISASAAFTWLWPLGVQSVHAQQQCFTQTGHCLGGRFAQYWSQNGGLPVFGYPLTDELTENGRSVQYFERQRFELHAENAAPYDVLLGLLGEEVLQQNGIDWHTQPVSPGPVANCLWFPQTQHNVCDQTAGSGFMHYWQTHGLEFDGQPNTSYQESLALFGLPVTEPFQDTINGETFQAQWFERARFEWHPSNSDPYKVLLGLVGAESHPVAPTPPTKQVSITVTAGAARTTIGLDQTALVASDATDMSVAIQFPERVDQGTFQVQLHQIPGRDAWQLRPASRTATLGEYVFDLNGGRDRPSYLRIEVTRGTGNPLIVFGVQVVQSQVAPALFADWNDPAGLVQSYYNAISRREYERAYSYWENPGAPNGVTPIFADFVSGFANVASVTATTGTIASDAGAGNIFYAVPTVISASQNDGTQQRFYGCYLLHRTNVEVGNTIPPYPITLRAAHISEAAASADPAALLAQANTFVQSGQCTQ